MPIKISAIICTHNRVRFLDKAIDSLAKQSLEKSNYEIIVVDNASSDSTKQLVVSKIESIGNVKYFFEPRLGLSCARNTGWQKALGPYIAYIDDDAISCSNWLEQIVEVFEKHPSVGIVGGKVDPIWEIPPPKWLTDNLKEYLSIIDWSDAPIFLSQEKNQWPVGANISYRKNLLKKFKGFNVNLGRKGKVLISNEEISLNKQIVCGGYEIFYSPSIRVKHHIPADRLEKNWFLSRFFWQGYSDALMECNKKDGTFKNIGLLLNNIKDIIISGLVHIRRFGNSFSNTLLFYYKIGNLYGIYVATTNLDLGT